MVAQSAFLFRGAQRATGTIAAHAEASLPRPLPKHRSSRRSGPKAGDHSERPIGFQAGPGRKSGRMDLFRENSKPPLEGVSRQAAGLLLRLLLRFLLRLLCK